MAEAAGLVLATVTLSGILRDCIDLLSLIDTARHFGHDSGLLATKLETEKTLFLHWAERVRLLSEDRDSRLDDEETQHAVVRIFSSIKALLSDGQALKARYGLDQLAGAPSGVTALTNGEPENAFVRRFEQLNRSTPVKCRYVSTIRRARWVVKDKVKFVALLNDLSYFVTKLNQLVPAEGQRSGGGPVHGPEAGCMLPFGSLTTYSALAPSQPSGDTSDMKRFHQAENRILEKLWYRSIDERKHAINVPHAETFQWALAHSYSDVQLHNKCWDAIAAWLRSKSGIYWLSGKAGSGKSTLVKHISGHENTGTLLREWSEGCELITAVFFFWALGPPEQRCLHSVFRTLLYQILDADRCLIPLLLPNMWREALSHRADWVLEPPSIAEMTYAFDVLVSQRDRRNRYCFFIDGLDEMEGDYSELVTFVQKLTRYANFKILVSSRPIPTYVNAFATCSKLHLQDLTRLDIDSYIQDTIGQHPQTALLCRADAAGVASLLSNLASRASGVFLWVVVACRSIGDGLDAFDNVRELQKRVDELPVQLEELYHHMLKRIPLRYRCDAARLLRLCHRRRSRESEGRVHALGLALVDEVDMDVSRFQLYTNLSGVEKQAKCNMLDGRLRSRCWGLLEMTPPNRDFDHWCFCHERDAVAWPKDQHYRHVDSTVNFMHRTVYEYLDSPKVLDSFPVDENSFDADVVLTSIFLQQAYLSGIHQSNQRVGFLKNAASCVARADGTVYSLLTHILNKFEHMLFEEAENDEASQTARKAAFDPASENFPSPRDAWRTLRPAQSIEHPAYISFLVAMELDMAKFAEWYQGEAGITLRETSSPFPLLYHTLCRPIMDALEIWRAPKSHEIVQMLLSAGCNPNQQCLAYGNSPKANTVWKRWLTVMIVDSNVSAKATADVTEALLRCGADIEGAEFAMGRTLADLLEEVFVEETKSTDPRDAEHERIKGRCRQLQAVIEARRARDLDHKEVAGAKCSVTRDAQNPIPDRTLKRRRS